MASAVLWWTPQEANAQVSVVNGGFESFQSLPDASGQFHLVSGWANGGSDVAIPDYYHQLGSNGGDLPQTPLAKVDAYAGRGIAGFVAFTDEASPRHEYLTGPSSLGGRPTLQHALCHFLWSGARLGQCWIGREWPWRGVHDHAACSAGPRRIAQTTSIRDPRGPLPQRLAGGVFCVHGDDAL